MEFLSKMSSLLCWSHRSSRKEESGLLEWSEIDRELAVVASATSKEVSQLLLDEIFQHVDYLKLLIVRR